MSIPKGQATDAPLALVTGASSGIGRSLVREFVDHGYDVVATAEDDAITGLGAELGQEYDDHVRPVRVDLASADGVERLYDEAVADGRPIAAAALNAGVGVGGRFDETGLDADLNLVDLNVRSTVHLAKLVAAGMVAEGEGRMLFTASVPPAVPAPHQATYTASKAFVHSFAEALRLDLADTGVSVTSLMPGPTDTAFFMRAGLEESAAATGPKDEPETVAAEGFTALMTGRPHVIPGPVHNRLRSLGGR